MWCSLLKEYHELYELQRKRLQESVGRTASVRCIECGVVFYRQTEMGEGTVGGSCVWPGSTGGGR